MPAFTPQFLNLTIGSGSGKLTRFCMANPDIGEPWETCLVFRCFQSFVFKNCKCILADIIPVLSLKKKNLQRSSLLFGGQKLFNSLKNISFSLNHPGAIHPIIQIVQCKTARAGRKWINSAPPPEQQRRPLPFLLSLSFFYCMVESLLSPPPPHTHHIIGHEQNHVVWCLTLVMVSLTVVYKADPEYSMGWGGGGNFKCLTRHICTTVYTEQWTWVLYMFKKNYFPCIIKEF